MEQICPSYTTKKMQDALPMYRILAHDAWHNAKEKSNFAVGILLLFITRVLHLETL